MIRQKGENIVNPNAKVADIKLRQALAYGLDVDQMTKAFLLWTERKGNNVSTACI